MYSLHFTRTQLYCSTVYILEQALGSSLWRKPLLFHSADSVSILGVSVSPPGRGSMHDAIKCSSTCDLMNNMVVGSPLDRNVPKAKSVEESVRIILKHIYIFIQDLVFLRRFKEALLNLSLKALFPRAIFYHYHELFALWHYVTILRCCLLYKYSRHIHGTIQPMTIQNGTIW